MFNIIRIFANGYAYEENNKLTLSAGANYIYGLREFVQIVEPGSSKFLNWEEKYEPVRSILTYAKFNYQEDDGSLTEFQTNLTSLHYNFSGGSIAARKGSLNESGSTPENEARFQHDLGIRYKSPNK